MKNTQEKKLDKSGAGKENRNENGAPDRTNGSLSRREFLKAVGLAAAGVAGLSATQGCQVISPLETQRRPFTLDRVPIPVQYPAVPYTPVGIPVTGALKFFTPHEARTVEAFTARLLPGSPEDPGAREAGVVYYIDQELAHPDGFPESIYRQPPYAATYDEDAPPIDDGQVGSDQVIWVPSDEIERYGYQSVLTPREVMRIGLVALDRYSNDGFDEDFIDLTEEQQDQIIEAMVEDEAEGFEPFSAKAFFHVMRRHTNNGMFSDPAYGGNRNMVGWRLIGFPGAQRAYTPPEIQIEGIGLRREPWSMAQLPPFNPGQPVGPTSIRPVTGTDEHDHDHEGIPSMPNFHRPYEQQFFPGSGQQLLHPTPGYIEQTIPPQDDAE
jgi:gluconate 2-dehydrogenase gamma chain